MMPNDIASALETAGPRILDTAQLLKCYAGNEHSLPRLELPNFQRDYVWGPDQWGQLWEDLVELSDENGQHFMGSLTLQKTGRTFQVLDGQQRLTTAMVLLDFLEAHVGEQSCSLGKLFVNANVCYQDVLGQEEEAEEVQSKRSAAEKRYQEIFEYFAKRHAVAGYPNQRPLLNKLKCRFFWLVDEIGSENNEHRTFEQLNATGKPLAYADFLLSYLLELHQQDSSSLTVGEVKAQWERLLADISRGELYEAEEALVLEEDGDDAEDGNTDESETGENISDQTETPGGKNNAGEDTGNKEADQTAERDGIHQPLKLKKFLNALGAVTLIWGGSVPETVESFQKTMSLLCGKAPEELKAEEILNVLKRWAAHYLALTNPRSKAYAHSTFEMERYYLSVLHTSALPMAMRVLDRFQKGKYQQEQVKAILGAVVRFSLYQRIYVSRSGSGLKSSSRKIMMLDYVLEALEAGRKFPLTMQNVLGVIMGEVPWHITEGRLQEAPYSSSVSKVLLCIAYDRWVDQHPGNKRIPELEREVGPFQVEHMVARNLPDGAFGQYGFNVSSVDQSRNLILLEQKLNNSLNNLTPEKKMGNEGWPSSRLYGYYTDLSTFPKKDGWSGLFEAQKHRMSDLWESFQSYMGSPNDPIPKDMRADKYPVLWACKKADIPQRVEPAWGKGENKEPTQQRKLYSLDKDFMYQLEPKKEAEVQSFYYYQRSLGENNHSRQKKNKQDEEPNTKLNMIGQMFFAILKYAHFEAVDGSDSRAIGSAPLYEYVASLTQEDPVSRMLAITKSDQEEPVILIPKKDQSGKIKWVKLSAVWETVEKDPERGVIWFNSKFSASDLCRRLERVYEHMVQNPERKVTFSFWVEVRSAVVQSVGGKLYYAPYINVGDPEAYRKFLESKTETNQLRLSCSEVQPVEKCWFRVEQKGIEDLLKFHLTIPEYQRRYVWNSRNWQEMLDYIMELGFAGKDSIPYGMIILCKDRNGGSYAVVDGQQRLTTLANFWEYACGIFPAQWELQKYAEIQGCLQKGPGAFLLGLLKKVRFTVLFLEGDDLPVTCPYQVFSAINGKGKKLTTAEKMKNLFFERLEKRNLDNDENRKLVSALLRNIRFPKAWLEMQKKEHISDEMLYGECKTALVRPGSNPLNEFLIYGKVFRKYLDGSRSTMDRALQRELLFYRSLGVTTGDALVLSWLTSLSEKDAAKNLKKLNMLYFLLYVMDRNGNDKKSINSKLPRLVGSQEALTIRCQKPTLTLLNESLWRDDDKGIQAVWKDFVCTYDLGGAKKSVARFLLLRIECWLGLSQTALNKALKGEGAPEVEHIHPISDPIQELHMNCLENIFLLEKVINISVSDRKLMDLDGGKKSKDGKNKGEKSGGKLAEGGKKSGGGRKFYSDSKLVMPGMFYDNEGPRWFSREGTYGKVEADKRMEEIWKRIEEQFRDDISSILPPQKSCAGLNK